jgi:hypothetical protein
MLWVNWIIFVVSVAVAAAIGGNLAPAQDSSRCTDSSAQKELSMAASLRVATPQQPGRILLKEGPKSVSRSSALQLTLKPTRADPDSPFLVQVYIKNLCEPKASESGELLGVVSFFHLQLREPVVFVLPPPEKGFPAVAPQDVQLTVKLVPVNPAWTLKNVAVEVVKAQFVE